MVRSPLNCIHWHKSTSVEHRGSHGAMEKYKGSSKLGFSVNFIGYWFKLHHPLLRSCWTLDHVHVHIESYTRFVTSSRTKDLRSQKTWDMNKRLQEIPFSVRGENPLKACLNVEDWLEKLADSLTNLLSCTGVRSDHVRFRANGID